MTVTVYKSTDSSAPVLTGQAGALAGVLDACLVNGYGSKSAAGWAIEFTGTNKRAYRAASGNRLRMRLDDSGTTIGRVIGYESMTDVDTGTAGFPLEAQVSGGLTWIKSTTADATARPWMVLATGTFFIVLLNTASSATSPSTNLNYFGDILSYKTSDSYGTVISGSTSSTVAVTTSRGWAVFNEISNTTVPVGNFVGHYIARQHTHVGGSTQIGRYSSAPCRVSSLATSQPMGSTTDYAGSIHSMLYPQYPNAADGSLLMDKVYVFEGATTAAAIRGELPGIWHILHENSVGNHGDTFTGQGSLSGKSFEVYKFTVGAVSGQIAVETSNTW